MSLRGTPMKRSNSFTQGSIYQPVKYTPMRNRKNMPEISASKLSNSTLNRSASFKSFRNDYKKPVTTFGTTMRVFNWEMYSTEQQEANMLKSMRTSLKKNKQATQQQQSRNEPVKAFGNELNQNQNQLNIDENIKVDRGQKSSFLNRVKGGSRPPSSAASMHSSIGFKDSYKEPKLNTLNVEDTKKLYGQGQFNIFSGKTLDERYQDRYGIAPEPKSEQIKQLNTKDMKKLYGQGEFDPFSGKTYDERYKQRYNPRGQQSVPQKPTVEKYNSIKMREVMTSQVDAPPLASQITEKPNRQNSQNLSRKLTAYLPAQKLSVQQVESYRTLKTDISMKDYE